MGKWLVAIDEEGIQAQFGLGSGDMEKNAEEEKKLKENAENRAKVIYVFEYEEHPGSGSNRRLQDLIRRRRDQFYQERGAFNPAEMMGYNMRKTTIGGNYIEVLADLPNADNIQQFQRNYSGLDGAIEILLSTEKIMHGAGKDPAKSVMKWIKKLELEKEED